MKILFITSFYSAIKHSIISNKWEPSGMPAIAKMYENLFSKQYKFDNIYIDNSSNKNYIDLLYNKRFNNI